MTNFVLLYQAETGATGRHTTDYSPLGKASCWDIFAVLLKRKTLVVVLLFFRIVNILVNEVFKRLFPQYRNDDLQTIAWKE